jgi:ABC-2 type transport system permease protein
MLTALTIVRELERGSLEGLLATPLKKAELLLGKLGPYFFIGMFDMFIVMGMGKYLFQVPLRGDPWLLIGMSAIFMVSTLGQGLLISVVSDNQLQAFQWVVLTSFLPAFFLSGAIFAIYLMPLPLRLATFVVPARYLVTISKGIYLKGIGLSILWLDALMLLVAAVVLVWLSIFKFVKKMR